MESTSPTASPPAAAAGRPPWARKILLLEMGAFELALVTLVLSTVFGILNYLNILRLSPVLPALSFLPHQAISSPRQEITTGVSPTPPAGTGALTTGKTLLLSYITDTITRSYLPDSLGSQPAIRSHDQLLLVWDDPRASASGVARLVFEPDQEHIQMERLSLQIRSRTPLPALSSRSATNLFSLLSPQRASNARWTCSTTAQCTTLITRYDGRIRQKQGWSLSVDSRSNTVHVSQCQVSQPSSRFSAFVMCP